MELFTQEVKDMKELKEILKDNNEITKDYEVAVIVYAFDKDNKIIFQRRGPGCRDERLKLETIGGRVKESDINFKSALKREIMEEECLGYEKYKIGEVDENELSNGAKELYRIVSKKYNYLK